jgi:prepilin-type N-terminal cleavage/methylation domain-containing protein
MKRNPESAPAGKQNGFTLVEIIVAMMVLSVGMLAMAASTGYVSSEIRNASWNTQRAMARARTIEQLQALPFDSISTTTTATTYGQFSMTWAVTNTNSNLRTVNVISSGPAYRLGKGTRTTIVDTVQIQIARQ